MQADDSDKMIMEQFRDAEKRNYAFHTLVKNYQERFYYLIRRMIPDHDDANDVLQNAFVKIWQHLGDFREESQLSTWLYRIVSNEALQFIRKKKKRYYTPIEDAGYELGASPAASEILDANEIQDKLKRAILSLPDKQRLVFNLRYYDEMPYEQMSQILGTSVGALKASYHHAAKKVEQILRSGF